ncbi:MAG: ABC transporter ATP-binding protein [Chloroflexi bacterium]|nr:MAG: ABC transporter ATP-binding protein [Chloroflexota bacterium]
MFHGGGWWGFVRSEADARPEINRELLKRIWGYAKPYRLWILFVLLGIFLASLLDAALPLVVREIINDAIPNEDLGRLSLLGLMLVVLPLLGGLVNVWQRQYSARVGEGIIFDLRCALYRHLGRMSLRFFTHTKSGELISRLNNDVVGAQSAITGTLIDLITNTITLVITLAVMLRLDWRLTLVAAVVLPLFIPPAQRIGRLLRRLRHQQLDANAEMTSIMQETLNVSGALLVKLFGREEDAMSRFRGRAREVRDLGVRQALVGRGFFVIIGLVGAVGTAAVYWLGGYLVITTDTFQIGDVVAFALYLPRLYGPLAALANARVQLATSLVSFERVFEVIDLPVEIRDLPGAVTLPAVKGRVEFEHVYFSYTQEDRDAAILTSHDGNGSAPVQRISDRRWALEDISFTVEPGQLAALVGPSGAGKSTITYLLPRLYDPTKGRVLIDGHDIRHVTLASLTANIGMVTQETYLFHDTIRANLLYAKPDAGEQEMVAACRAANIHDLIASLPDGYDTVVGERGYRFSGGEKQRIAIARVILKNPRILVLDEATSSLDSESEALIQAALEPLMKERTSIVIAHRLSTILAADVILVIDQGRLVERGTHHELLALDGVYARLYNTQFREQAPTPVA